MEQPDKIKQRVISPEETLISALKIMDRTGFRSLLVLDNCEKFAGILSIGDIQRAIITNVALETKIGGVLRTNPRVARNKMGNDQIKEEMIRYRMEFIPVITEDDRIDTVYFWEDLFSNKKLPPRKYFNLPVIIMAGGIGSRLKPLTNVLPKPLIPIGDKTIIEEIMGRFSDAGCNRFYLSVNYKAEMIKYYLNSLAENKYSLEYFEEKKPLGTAGSLFLIKDRIDSTFFVSNCDIIIEQDYSEILDYHYQSKNDITLVAVLKHHAIPYGVVETGADGALITLQEKPEITYKINSGMYILERNVLDEIPEDTFFHITELIEKMKTRGGRVGVFPVSEKSWRDIGDWTTYLINLSDQK